MKAKVVGALTAAAAVGAILLKVIEALLGVLKEAPVDPVAVDSTVAMVTRFLGIG